MCGNLAFHSTGKDGWALLPYYCRGPTVLHNKRSTLWSSQWAIFEHRISSTLCQRSAKASSCLVLVPQVGERIRRSSGSSPKRSVQQARVCCSERCHGVHVGARQIGQGGRGQILHQSMGVDRFGNGTRPLLNSPFENHLRWCGRHALRNIEYNRRFQQEWFVRRLELCRAVHGTQGTVTGQVNVLGLAKLEQ
jgi:hypothetical protein